MNGYYVTVTNLIQKLSEKYYIPASTLRWNIKQLRRLQLIECGTLHNKGVPAKLTVDGKVIVEILDLNSFSEIHNAEDLCRN